MKERAITIVIFLAVAASSFCFGYDRLGKFSGVDEPLWSFDRVPQFWNAVGNMKWKNTSLCDKPGVTLAAISGAGLLSLSENPKHLEQLRYAPKTPEQLQMLNSLYFHLRLPVFLFALGMLGAFYLLIKRLLGSNIARASIVFIGLSPILLGISVMINTDAILWSLLPLALLSFLVYQKEDSRKFLYLGGFLLGIALIDKYIANILFPFFLGLILLKYAWDENVRDAEGYFKKSLADFGLLILVSVATIFVLFPAAWVKPKALLEATILSKAFHGTWPFFSALVVFAAADAYLFGGRILGSILDPVKKRKKWLRGAIYAAVFALMAFVLINTYSGMGIFDFQPVFNSPTSQLAKINRLFGEPFAIMLSSFFPLLFGLVPGVAILFIFSVFRSGRGWMGKGESTIVFQLLLFILFYYLGSALSGVSPTVRYQIVLYPLASIIAAVGLRHLANLEGLKKYLAPVRSFFIILLIVFVSSIYSLFSIRPFFLSYASDLLPKRYVLNLRDMGDGSWEAAQYLNGLPDAKDLKVWSDKGGVCEAFVGTCSDTLNPNKLDTVFDYFVVTAGREAKSERMAKKSDIRLNNAVEIRNLYSRENPHVFGLEIGGRAGNFVKVMKADALP